jgi:hypothetical protein
MALQASSYCCIWLYPTKQLGIVWVVAGLLRSSTPHPQIYASFAEAVQYRQMQAPQGPCMQGMWPAVP